MTQKRKNRPWAICNNCGDKEYPKADMSLMRGCTLHMGDCQSCGAKDVVLTPRVDYEYATYKNPALWD